MSDREFSLAQSAFAILREATNILHPDPEIVEKLHPLKSAQFYSPEGREIYLAWLDSPKDNQPLIAHIDKFFNTIIGHHYRSSFGITEGQKPVMVSRYGWEDGKLRSWKEIADELDISPAHVKQFDINTLRRLNVYGRIGDFIPSDYPRRRYWEKF
jgi:hypothetical protein